MKGQRIGQLGLGNAGYCYAVNLIKAGKSLIGFDPDINRRAQLVEAGGSIARSTREIAETCNVIVLSLPNPKSVREALLGDDGVITNTRSGTLLIDISTIDEETALTVDAAARAREILYLEAPMSGGEPGGAGTFGATGGTITFMCGGTPDVYEQAKPILDIIGKHSFLLGPVGTGNKIKLISNLIAGLNMAVMAEGFLLGKAAGFDFDTLFKVFKYTDAKSYTMFEEFQPHLLSNDYSYGFPVELMHKDHRLAGELAHKLGIALPFNDMAKDVYQKAIEQGLGRESHVSVIKTMARELKVDI